MYNIVTLTRNIITYRKTFFFHVFQVFILIDLFNIAYDFSSSFWHTLFWTLYGHPENNSNNMNKVRPTVTYSALLKTYIFFNNFRIA